MPKKAKTVRVRPVHGEPLRYHVESWGDPEHFHTVDLAYNDGTGFCDCWDFIKRCSDNRKKNPGVQIPYGNPESPNKNRTWCRHIDAARSHFTNTTLRDISREMRKRNQ